MNWKGKIVAFVLWTSLLSGLGSLVYVSIRDSIKNYNVAIQLVADVDNASRGKLKIIDVRINDDTVQLFYETGANTNSTGMTDIEGKKVKELIQANLEWSMINRGVVLVQFNWAREDRSGKLYNYFQVTCLAQNIVEDAPNPSCDELQRWYPLPKRNQRFRT